MFQISFLDVEKRKSGNYQNSDRPFVLKWYTNSLRTIIIALKTLGFFFVLRQTWFFLIGFIPHPWKTFSPKGHKKSAIRNIFQTLFNPLILQSNIQVNFEMFYHKYIFDMELKAYLIHRSFGLTIYVFSMHLIYNCIAIWESALTQI